MTHDPSCGLALAAVAVTALASCSALGAPAAKPVVTAHDVDSVTARVDALYEQLHRAPELSNQEAGTSARLAQELRGLGYDVQAELGGHGVVGVLKNGPGKTLLLRTDMDALPIAEETGVPFASSVRAHDDAGNDVPVMHACGHDVHMAAWVGTADYLSKHRQQWSGTIVLVAQPAEEKLSGARALLKAGLLTRFPRPDVAFAIHVHDQLALGSVGYTSGPFAASADSVDLVVHGRGGHGAYPQHTIDPIVIASRIVLGLQTIVSRENDPFDPAVVSVGSFHGGTKHNAIPDSVKLQLTVRTYRPATRTRVLAAISRIANAEAAAAGAETPPTITVSEGTATAVSDPASTKLLVAGLRKALPNQSFVELPPEMGSEDFGEYASAGVPSVMLQVGVANPEKVAASKQGGPPLVPIHSGKFLPVRPDSLRNAILVETNAVLTFLPAKTR
jgi:hippurate hydrolase